MSDVAPPPTFSAFLVIWLTGIEHRKYQNNQYWNAQKTVAFNFCGPQKGNIIVASGYSLIRRYTQ
jgi:hypothetical protein